MISIHTNQYIYIYTKYEIHQTLVYLTPTSIHISLTVGGYLYGISSNRICIIVYSAYLYNVIHIYIYVYTHKYIIHIYIYIHTYLVYVYMHRFMPSIPQKKGQIPGVPLTFHQHPPWIRTRFWASPASQAGSMPATVTNIAMV